MKEVVKFLRPQETLGDAAQWPDTIKSITYEDEDTALFRLRHPSHDAYHYTDLPFQDTKYDLNAIGTNTTDVVQMAAECIRVLKGSSKTFTERQAIRLLAHYVGDMHQPLHVGSAYVSAAAPLAFVVPKGPTGWRMAIGGNALRYGPDDQFNLHGFWDSRAVTLAMQQDDVPAFVARLLKEQPVEPAWANSGPAESWPEQWANEALQYAKDIHKGLTITAYLGPDAERRTAHRWRIELPPDYDQRARERARVQLAKAGYRLAATLKAVWPDSQ